MAAALQLAAGVGQSRFSAATRLAHLNSRGLIVSGTIQPSSHPEKYHEVKEKHSPSDVRELPINGHCKLSTFMAVHPEIGIFHGFSDLNTYNLLALQSELCYLRYEFHDAVQDNYATSKMANRAPLDYNMRLLSQSNSEQWKILLQIRGKLNEYSIVPYHHKIYYSPQIVIARADTALQQHIDIRSQPEPTKHNLNNLQHFLASEQGCHNELRGIDSTIWDVGDNTTDFVSLSNKHVQRDLFLRWVEDTLLKWWHEKARPSCLVSILI